MNDVLHQGQQKHQHSDHDEKRSADASDRMLGGDHQAGQVGEKDSTCHEHQAKGTDNKGWLNQFASFMEDAWITVFCFSSSFLGEFWSIALFLSTYCIPLGLLAFAAHRMRRKDPADWAKFLVERPSFDIMEITFLSARLPVAITAYAFFVSGHGHGGPAILLLATFSGLLCAAADYENFVLGRR